MHVRLLQQCCRHHRTTRRPWPVAVPKNPLCSKAHHPRLARTVLVVGGGICTFFAADYVASVCLNECGLGSNLSPAACIIVLGAGAAHPRLGPKLNALLGPGAAWLRTGLPLFLTPCIVAPLAVDVPEEAAKMVALVGATILGTVAVTGNLISRLVPSAAATGDVVLQPASITSATAAAKKAISHAPTAMAAAACGTCLSIALACMNWSGGESAATGEFSGQAQGSSRFSPAAVRAPVYAGMSVGSYILFSRFFPPILAPVTGGLAMVALLPLLGQGTMTEVEHYLEGAGAWLLAPVSPAMATLSLYAHTHRALLLRSWKLLLGTSLVAAPAGMLATAFVGSRVLGLPPSEVATVIPCTTTTGLAITMDIGGLQRPEHVALGPLCCSIAGILAYPLLLRATGLAGAGSLAQGFALGGSSHVGVMVALDAGGKIAAAEAAALGFFCLGTTRCLLLEVPVFNSYLASVCGASASDGSVACTPGGPAVATPAAC